MVDYEQRALAISEVAVDWQEPMVLQHKCGHPLPALTGIGTTVAASKHTTAPINHTRPSPRKHSPDVTTSTEIVDTRLLLTTHLSTSKGWKAELAGLQRMVYPHKWSPISCRPSAGQRKHASQGLTFYQWTMQPKNFKHKLGHIMPLRWQLECRPMSNVMAALPNIGGALCSTP